MIKKYVSILFILVIPLTLGGCGIIRNIVFKVTPRPNILEGSGSETDEEQSVQSLEEDEITNTREDYSNETDDAQEDDELNILGDTKRVGQEFYGYVDIPKDWVNFIDVDKVSTAIQFSDIMGQNIITIDAVLNPDADPKNGLSALAHDMESEGAVEVTGATVSLNGIDAFQVYGIYPENNLVFVSWAFKTDDGYIHFVSAEGPIDSIVNTTDMLESTYTLEEKE